MPVIAVDEMDNSCWDNVSEYEKAMGEKSHRRRARKATADGLRLRTEANRAMRKRSSIRAIA